MDVTGKKQMSLDKFFGLDRKSREYKQTTMRTAFIAASLLVFFLPLCSKAQNGESISIYLDSLKGGVEVSILVQNVSGEVFFSQQADKKIPSASIIKIPILIRLFDQVEKGNMALDQMYRLQEEDKVGGSGELQNQATGSSYSIEFLAREMIRISDNTATNILIRKIGMDEINAMLQSFGFQATQLNRMMMDFDAIKAGKQNYTSPEEINHLLLMLLSGELLTQYSRDKILEMLKGCADNSTIPSQLPASIQVAHKTGTLDYVRGDAGIVFGERPLVISVFVENFEELSQAEEIIGKISRLVYEAYSR